MAKIIITDPIAASAVENLKALGHDVCVNTDHPKDKLAEIIAPYEVHIIRSATKIRAPLIDKMESMKMIIRGGVGIDNIDHQYAESKGIKVRNTPTASSDSVAELALSHMFAIYRFIPQANLTMRQSAWNKKQYKGRELAGKTLGIIGIGRIGQSLAKKAIALGMKVVAHDLYIKSVDVEGVKMDSMENILKNSDLISLHIPSGDKPTIGKAEIAMMKKDAVLINCARGGVVDEEALCDALDSGQLSGAGIDVFVQEPTKNERLVNHPLISVTPHIGASTKEAQDRVGTEIVAIIKEAF